LGNEWRGGQGTTFVAKDITEPLLFLSLGFEQDVRKCFAKGCGQWDEAEQWVSSKKKVPSLKGRKSFINTFSRI